MSNELPRNVEAERALVGSVLIRNGMTDRAARVKPEHFSDVLLRELWGVISRLSAENQEIDTISVGDACKGLDFENKVPALLTSLVGNVVPTSMHIDKYAAIVETTAAKRKLAIVLNKIAKIAFSDGKYDPGAVFAEAIVEIEKAGEGMTFFDRERWTAAELAALEVTEDPWMLDGLLIEGGLNLVAGEFASGKTFCVLDLAIGAASGGMAWGRKVKPSTVLYFGADNSRSNLVRRVRALAEGRGIDPPHETLTFDLSPLDLSTSAGMAVIREAIAEHQADLVIVDAVIRYLGALDENAAADIGRLMAGFRDMANATGATIVLIHHLRKLSGQLTKTKIADRIRGSGDFLGAVDSAVVLSTKGEGSSLVRNMIHVKCREAEESDPLSFEIHEGDAGGLLLSFGMGDAAIAAATLAEAAAGIMAGVLQREAGIVFTTSDLKDELANAGMGAKDRTIKTAFTLLRQMSTVMMKKVGRANTYTWNEIDPSQ